MKTGSNSETNFDKRKISTRLRSSYLTIAGILIFVTLLALFNVSDLSGRLKEFSTNSMEVVNQSWLVRRNILFAQGTVYKLCMTENESARTTFESQLEEAKNNMNAALKEIEKLNPEDSALVKEATELIGQIIPIEEKAIEYGKNGQSKEAENVLENEYSPLLEKVNNVALEIADKSNNEATKYVINSGTRSKVFMGFTIVVSVLTLVLVLGMAKWNIDGIVKPLNEVGDAMDELAKGNLDYELKYESKNEIGFLAGRVRSTYKHLQKYIQNIDDTLHEMSNKNFAIQIDIQYRGKFSRIKESLLKIAKDLNGMTLMIKNAAEGVAAGSEQIASVAQNLADGTQEQSDNVKDLLNVISDVSEQVEENAEDAKKVSGKSFEAQEVINTGNEHMEELIKAMDDITDSSEQISKIITVIEGISGQTNMLALNASIEAARAGEHGKGFAVVADEIGQLAKETNEATKTTTNLIHKSLEAVQKGGALVSETAEALKQVVVSANQISELAENVSHSSAEQSHSLTKVNQTVEQISEVVQNNASIAQEAAASSEELTAHAGTLTDIMEDFKLKE